MPSLSDFFNEDTVITLDPAQDNFYDPDTTHPIDGDRYRLTDLDAPEAPTWHSGKGYLEGLYQQEHLDQINQAVEEGYTELRPIGERGHWNRPLAELTNAYGLDYATEYTREGLLGPSKYAIENADLAYAHAYANFKRVNDETHQLPAWRQAEIIAQQALAAQPIGMEQRDLTGTIYEPLDNNWSKEQEEGTGAFDISESLEYWWLNNKTAIAGLGAMLDPETGKRRVGDIQQEFGDRIDPDLVVSLEQVESGSDALAFVANNTFIQGPDFAILMAGTALAPFTGGLSAWAALGYTFLKSTGSYAAESVEVQGEVNVGEAVAAGTVITVLDKFGATKALSPAEFITKEGREKLVTQIAQSRGITPEAARTLLDQASTATLKDFSRDISISTNELLGNKQIALSILRRIAERAGTEGMTEAAQESIQYLGIHGMPQTAEDWKKFGVRLADATAAGAAVGGVYTTPMTLKEHAQIKDFVRGFDQFDPNNANRFARDSYNTYNAWGNTTVEEAAREYASPVSGRTINEWAAMEQRGWFGRGIDKLRRGDLTLGGAAAYNLVKSRLYDADGNIRKGVALLGNIEGGLQTMPGATLYNKQASVLGGLQVQYGWMYNPETSLGISNEELGIVIHALRTKDNSNLTENQDKAARQLAYDLHVIHNQLMDIKYPQGRSVIDKETGYLELLSTYLPDPNLVSPKQQAFTNLLSNAKLTKPIFGRKPGDTVGYELANRITTKLLSNRDVDTLYEDLDSIEITPEFDEFFHKNPLQGVKNNIIRTTKDVTNTAFRGGNLEVYSNILNELYNSGDFTELEIAELAKDIKDQVDKGDNVFGRSENDKSRRYQEVVRVFTTLGVMDWTLFAQAGEAAAAFVGTDANVPEAIGKMAHNWWRANALWINSVRGKEVGETQEALIASGYFDEAEIAKQQGVPVETRAGLFITKWFFRINQVAPITDAMRMSRMQMATGVIQNLAEQISRADLSNPTAFEMQAIERILFYGGDPEILRDTYNNLKGLTDKQIQEIGPNDPTIAPLYDQWDVMTPKFIDEFSPRVKPGSRPGLFEEKRWGMPLFTQFMSFTAHWSANQLPRLYQVYLGSGGTMAYQAFAVAAASILMAYFSQFTKDWIKYGEESPYLEEWGGLHRAFLYSGLMGWTAEGEQRFIRGPYGYGAGYKIVEEGTPISEAVSGAVFEAPSASHLQAIGSKIFDGEYAAAAKRAIPWIDQQVLTLEDFTPDDIEEGE